MYGSSVSIKKQWLLILSFLYCMELLAAVYKSIFIDIPKYTIVVTVANFFLGTFLFFVIPFLLMYDCAYRHNGIKLLVFSMLLRSQQVWNTLIEIINQIKSGYINWGYLVYTIFVVELVILFLLSSYRLYKFNRSSREI